MEWTSFLIGVLSTVGLWVIVSVALNVLTAKNETAWQDQLRDYQQTMIDKMDELINTIESLK